MSENPNSPSDPAEPGAETIHVGWLPPGTRVRWADGAGRSHEGTVVSWPDRHINAEGVRVIETVVTEIQHVLSESRRVEVAYVAGEEEG